MPEVTPEGLIVYKGFEMFHERPDMFIGPKPWGPKLSGLLMDDLVSHGALPSTVDSVEDWWLVSTQKDWLLSGDAVCLEPFSKGGRSPRGSYVHRAEILIAAYATVAVTAGRDGLQWIVGGKNKFPLPSAIEKSIANIGNGRLVALKVDET